LSQRNLTLKLQQEKEKDVLKGKMIAQVFYEPRDMTMEEVDIPQISADEILVKVEVCGICGSDIAYYGGATPVGTSTGKGPLILGHEISGKVAEVGPIVKARGLLHEGDRVTINPVQACNHCFACSKGKPNVCANRNEIGVSVNGGFAEYVKCRYDTAYNLPQNISFEEGAIIEPLACATYGVKNLELEAGDQCVLFGPGPIGLMMVQMIKRGGAASLTVIGTRDYRLELASELGADKVININEKGSSYFVKDLKKEISELTKGRMADKAICVTSSMKAMEDALEVTGSAGRIVYFGLPGPEDILRVPVLNTHLQDKTIRFSFLAPFMWFQAIQAADSGTVRLDRLITHRFHLKDTPNGLILGGERGDCVIKAVVVM
jgi:L-iditol 2-dehydrogenase